jgi:NADPH-dependent curcumin reductase CurA
MTEAKARQIILAARPQGKPNLTDFHLEETAIPTPSAGEVLLRVQYLSLDAYMRGGCVPENERQAYQRVLTVPKGNDEMTCHLMRW